MSEFPRAEKRGVEIGKRPEVPRTLAPLEEGVVRGPAVTAVDLSVIIVTYESRDEIEACLKSFLGKELDLSLEVFVVDNASTDGTAEFVEETFPSVEVLANPENLGYGVANNRALARSRGRFVLFLNPDTEVEPRTLQHLVRFAEKEKGAGIVGCRLLMSDGRMDLACRRSFPTPLVSLWRLLGLARCFPQSRRFARYNLTYLDPEGTYEVDAVVGALMLVRGEVLERVGAFDSRFFLYGEDLDLCFRVSAAGSKVLYHGGLAVRHRKRASSRKNPWASTRHFHRAMLLFYDKHYRRSYPVWVRWVVHGAVRARLAGSLVGLTVLSGLRRIPKNQVVRDPAP